jgi:hypothetical protein
MAELARRVRGPGRVYLTGGATALLHGFREMTKDVDLSFDPEPPGAGDALRVLKDQLDINVELASPADFIPALPGWEDRSRFIERFGDVDFFHYDPYAQTLAKIERGHAQDLEDARAFVERALVEPARLESLFVAVRERLLSATAYISVDPDAFEEKVRRFLASLEAAGRARSD